MPKKKAALVAALTTQLGSPRQAESLTRALARRHYENFLVASVLLPKQFRQAFFNVYCFCRIADDLADHAPSPEIATDDLSTFRRHLEAAFAGAPTSNLFLALHTTIRQFHLSQQPFHDLLDAFQQDQVKFRYQSHQELLEYCRRSANPVGRIVLQLADSLNPETASLSDQICTGLQLANHWQDVGRDHAIGRIYLPVDQWQRCGVDESSFFGVPAGHHAENDGAANHGVTPAGLRQLLAEQCDLAQQHLSRGLTLAERVPGWLASDVRLFAHGGLQTLAAIRRIDYDVLAKRPTVGKWTQAKLVAKAMIGRL